MPFQVSIGKKPPKFDRDLPTFNVTVKGPQHLFTKEVTNWLFLQGLNRLSSNGAYETWSTRYNIGAPSQYIGAYLAKKYETRDRRGKVIPGATFDIDLGKGIKAATEAFHSEDGLDALFGGGKNAGVKPGDGPLQIAAGSRDFVVNCSLDNKARQEFLMGAGFLPLKNPSEKLKGVFGSMPFATRDPLIASNLEHFMTANAAEKVKVLRGEAMANIQRSKSQDIPDGFNVPVPEGLDYLPFQKGGIDMVAKNRKNAIIADDMGLGKTIQAIGVLNATPNAKRVLIICQANMRLKWVQEVEKWKVNPDLTVNHAEGNKFPDTDIVVINYDIASRHWDKIHAQEWDLVFADEAHNMKNEEAQRTQAILGTLSKDPEDADFTKMVPLKEGGILVHLTGTPKPNRIAELWPLLTSTRPDIWGRGPEDRQAFLNRYEPPTLIEKSQTRNGRTFKTIIPLPGKPIRELELQMRLRASGSFMRRMKRDTKGLPDKFRTSIPLPYSLSKEDNNALKQAGAAFEQLQAKMKGISVDKIAAGKSGKAAAVIDVITGAPAGSPEFHEIARMRHNVGVVKAPICAKFILEELKADKELAEELRRKTVIFAHHSDVIKIVKDHIEADMKGSVLVYDGSITSAKKRQAIVDTFQNDPKKRVVIISLSGATGITLTAAHRMRVIEPDWSPSNMVQIEDRIWRIGQQENCDIGYLFLPNSLDTLVGNALMRKMETDERALNTMSLRGMKERKVETPEQQDLMAEEVAEAQREAELAEIKKAAQAEPAQEAFQF